MLASTPIGNHSTCVSLGLILRNVLTMRYLQSTALSYISKWHTLTFPSGSSRPSFYYGDTSSTGMLYNLYADLLLELYVVDDTTYKVTSSYYDNIVGSSTYGFPIFGSDQGVSAARKLVVHPYNFYF